LQQDDLRQALADIDAALVCDQNDFASYILRAQIHERLGETALATQDYNTVVKRDTFGLRADKRGESSYYRSLAIAEQKLGLSDKASLHFRLANTVKRGSSDPDNYEEGWLNQGF
jgi:tetratricopeptide (TPR) repeat protein